MEEILNIVLCSDEKYRQHLATTICSICKNNSSPVNLYIINDGISDETEKILTDFVKTYEKKSIFFINISEKINESFLASINESLKNSYLSIVTYYRLFLTELLPETIDKVIYLDCDLIVRQDLTGFYNTDMTDSAIAGVIDTLSYEISTFNRLRYEPSLKYINAGVLLINLDYWRKHNVLSEFKNFIKNNPDKLKFHDQDVLNYIFREKKLILPFTYNLHDGLLRKEISIPYTYWEDIYKCEKNPVIIHYSNSRKPWQTTCLHPFQEEYLKYQNMTPFKTTALEKPEISLKSRIKKSIRKIFSKLKLCKPEKQFIFYRDLKLDD